MGFFLWERRLTLRPGGLRTGLIQRDPEMRAAMLNQFTGMVDQVAEVLEARVGERASNFAVRNLAGAIIGVLMSAVLVAANDPEADLIQLTDAAMAHLEAGLPLGETNPEPGMEFGPDASAR